MKKKMSLHNSLILAMFLVVIALAGCSGARIHSRGIRHVHLGSEMPPIGVDRFHGFPAKDTLFSENDFDWRVVKVTYPTGIIWIESAFMDSRHVGRIRIETPALKVRNRIQTGEVATEVLKYAEEWRIRSLKEYQYLEASSPQFPHIYFLFSANHLDFEGDVPTDFRADEIPETARLEKIVVM